jgi:hypothetical protein
MTRLGVRRVRRALTVARRLAIKQARVRISARHHRGKINKKSGSVGTTKLLRIFRRVQAFVFLQETLQWTLEVFTGFLNCELLREITREVTKSTRSRYKVSQQVNSVPYESYCLAPQSIFKCLCNELYRKIDFLHSVQVNSLSTVWILGWIVECLCKWHERVNDFVHWEQLYCFTLV